MTHSLRKTVWGTDRGTKRENGMGDQAEEWKGVRNGDVFGFLPVEKNDRTVSYTHLDVYKRQHSTLNF